ncbi:MOG interacting and ectopic P-granules protein 1, partial [Pseudolycoriella hygida]
RNQVQFSRPEDPKFLKLIKEQIGYKNEPSVDTKRQKLNQEFDDSSDSDDEQPQIVVTKVGDLSAEQVEAEKQRIESVTKLSGGNFNIILCYQSPLNSISIKCSVYYKEKCLMDRTMIGFCEVVNPMGEVGTNSPDSPSVNMKMNGVNGVYEDEQMEVDDSQNSQESSELSAKQSEASDISSDVRDQHAKPTLEPIPESNTQEECDDESADKSESESGNDGNVKCNSIVSQENGDNVEGKEEDGSTMDTEIRSEENDDGGDEIRIEGKIVHENVDEAMEQDEVEDDEDALIDEKNPLEESDEMDKTTEVTNGDGSVDDDVEHVPIADEVHAISDSDEEEQPAKENSIPSQMEVDGKSNGHNKIDDDKPVSIPSDSEEEQGKGEKNGIGTSEQNSDNEDCVVIEDDNKKDEEADTGPRRSSRARKSVLNVRDFASFEEVDEICKDPLSQNVAKKPKLSAAPPAPLGITIQDARSLAPDPLSTSSTGGASFQQQFIQAQANSANKKEPTLVIIDTNQIMARGSAQQAAAAAMQSLQSQNFSVHPVGVPAQGVYPTNSRASITPIVQKSPPKPTTAPLLLPALTDDMFVLEAPSFIVPYIYEKPPSDNLKDIVEKVGKQLAEQRKKEEEAEKREAKENATEKDKETNAATPTEAVPAKPAEVKKKKKKPVQTTGDESWDELESESSDEELSDDDTTILIKAVDEDLESIKTHIITPDAVKEVTPLPPGAKRDNYFDSPLGKFFMDIGVNLVQEHVQTDLLRQQKRKLTRGGETAPPSVQTAINSLKKNLELSKEKNDIFKFETKRCEFCNFKSESALAMAHHYETPHILNQHMYRCNFCTFETRPPYDILFHMEAVHNIKARLEKAITYHQCPNCPFEDNGKSKLARHSVNCLKKFNPEENLNPPLDWEPPAKIPRIKPKHGLVGTATAYQAMAAQAQRAASGAAMQRQNAVNAALMRGRGRPQTITKPTPTGTILRTNQQPIRPQIGGMVLPNNFQLGTAGQFIQVAGTALAMVPNAHSAYTNQPPGPKSSKTQQPSISITPLPRQPSNAASSFALQTVASQVAKPTGAPSGMKPGQSSAGGKATFVICEICDGYIKDLDQLRNHMQWMHKVKIHPKMIYNRPPLNCQKCQFRFFTDQGLERHLLGSHGLVTSSMQEAANKGKDAGRCPMYQWKLLNHVSRDHNMTLKPAHLSYKCTVCTATFGMYKQFENHVYSAHSTVAKKAMDNKKAPGPGSSKSNDSLLKPLKINDEITIIPQPASRHSQKNMDIESHIKDFRFHNPTICSTMGLLHCAQHNSQIGRRMNKKHGKLNFYNNFVHESQFLQTFITLI